MPFKDEQSFQKSRGHQTPIMGHEVPHWGPNNIMALPQKI